MVGATTHEMFVEKVCEKFDRPKKYINWGRGPDYGYWFSDFGNRVMHRFTLHGMKNIQSCIDLLREKDKFEYDEEDDDLIRVAVASHSYLDLFNFWVVPSYPKSGDLKYIPEQKGYYLKSGFSHFFPERFQQPTPSQEEWGEAFEEILEWFDDLENLMIYLEEEYYRQPDRKGCVTKKILDLYRGD